MRKIKRITLLVLLLLTMAIAGCGKNNEEPEQDEEPAVISIDEYGEWQENKYVLTGYNLAFEKPESWKRLLPDEIDELFGEGKSEYYKMIVVNNTSKIIITMFFENSNGMNQEEYLESIKGVMKKESVTYAFEDITAEDVGYMEFAVMRSHITKGLEDKMLSNQIYLAQQQGERMLCINIKYDADYEQVVRDTLAQNFMFNEEVDDEWELESFDETEEEDGE